MHERIVGEVLKNNDLQQIIGKQNFQEDIIATFEDFFINREKLVTYSNDYLIQDYLGYKRNDLHPHRNALMEVLSLLNTAKAVSSEKTFYGLAFFQITLVEMGNKHWSMIKLQNDFDSLEPYEYVAECFHLIEYSSENLLKYLFSLMVYLLRVINGENPKLEDVQKINFGILLDEIRQSNRLNATLSILNSNISISQWRNIACHKSYQYLSGQINCQYGAKLQHSATISTKEELLLIAKSIYKISQVILLPTKLFLYDNLEQLRNKMNELSVDIVNFRDEDWKLVFVTELLANGLITTDISNGEKLKITVQDTQNGSINDRIVGIPIAAYKAWVLTGKNEIEIVYVKGDGNPYVAISLTADVCEKVSNYEEDFSYLAKKMVVKKYRNK